MAIIVCCNNYAVFWPQYMRECKISGMFEPDSTSLTLIAFMIQQSPLLC